MRITNTPRQNELLIDAEELAETLRELVNKYMKDVAADQPLCVQRRALWMLGSMLIGINGCCFCLPPLDDV